MRDAALLRLRRATTWTVAGTVAGVGVLTAAVAGTVPGRHHSATTSGSTSPTSSPTSSATTSATTGSDEAPQGSTDDGGGFSAPTQAPQAATVPAPPVAVSGGS